MSEQKPRLTAPVMRGLVSMRTLTLNVLAQASDEALEAIESSKRKDLQRAAEWVRKMDERRETKN